MRTRRVAALAIRSPGRMTKRERRDVAAWLRKQADNMLRHGGQYTDGKFTAGFSYLR